MTQYENWNECLKKACEQNFIDQTGIESKILHFCTLLSEWNTIHNLTSHRTTEEVIYKDIVDNLIAAAKLNQLMAGNSKIMDFGAGAGFTGIIFSLTNPKSQVTFVESSRKKINFIRQICLELGISANFINKHLNPQKDPTIPTFDIAICRAVMNIADFHNHVQNYVHNNGHLIYLAGPNQKVNLNTTTQPIDFKNEIQYDILPYNFSRKILIYVKK